MNSKLIPIIYLMMAIVFAEFQSVQDSQLRGLQSGHFSGNRTLEAALNSDPAHITPGRGFMTTLFGTSQPDAALLASSVTSWTPRVNRFNVLTAA